MGDDFQAAIDWQMVEVRTLRFAMFMVALLLLIILHLLGVSLFCKGYCIKRVHLLSFQCRIRYRIPALQRIWLLIPKNL
jgi:hypothetical protein